MEMSLAKTVHALQHKTEHVVSWSDASGVSRNLSGIICVDDKYHYTDAVVPEHIGDQLLDRGDHQIGFQEMSPL